MFRERKLLVMKGELEACQRQRSEQLSLITTEYQKFQVSWFNYISPPLLI